MTKEDFLKKFEKMSDKERSTVALMFDYGFKSPVSWFACWLEIKTNTKFGEKILKQIK